MTKPVVPEATLIQQRKESTALTLPLKSRVTAMLVKTADDYEVASGVLQQILQAKATVTSRINLILDPINSARNSLLELRRELIQPFDELEAQTKERMRAFKIEEARLLREADAKRIAEEAALAEEVKAKEWAAAKARTAAMRDKLAQQQAEAAQRLSTLRNTETAAPVKTASSSTRTVKTWKVKDLHKFLIWLVNQENAADLLGLVSVDSAQMTAYFRLEKPAIGDWLPGIVVEEDIQIAGRK